MEVNLLNCSHKFGREKIFSGLSLSAKTGEKWLIRGDNGSGKSTLLKILMGSLEADKGELSYRESERSLSKDEIYQHLSLCTPYFELIEEFTATEMFTFYSGFKNMKVNSTEFMQLSLLEKQKNKRIKDYSSGMKQRLKLALAITSNTKLLFLDEPLSNVDKKHSKWYQELIQTMAMEKTIFIASNQQEDEYFCCEKEIDIQDYK